MSVTRTKSRPRRPAAPLAFDPYSYVVLTHAVEAAGGLYPADTRGVIVYCHDDGIGYEAEFEAPRLPVLTLTSCDLECI